MRTSWMILIGVLILTIVFCGSDGVKPVVENITIDSLSFSMQEGSDPCSDVVGYALVIFVNQSTTAEIRWGSSAALLTNTLNSNTPSTKHTFILNPVLVDSTYHYSAKFLKEDGTDSLIRETSSFKIERTTVTLPELSNTKILPYNSFAWLYSQISHPSRATILYGETANYTDSIAIDSVNSYIYEKIENLSPNTTYHYSISLQDNCGNLVLPEWDSTFTTPPEAKLYFDPDTISGEIGDTINMDVYIENTMNLFSIQFQIDYPGELMIQTGGVREGDLIRDFGNEHQHIYLFDNPTNPQRGRTGAVSTWTQIYLEEDNDKIWGSHMKHPYNEPGHLATFNFRVLKAGTTEVVFDTSKVIFEDAFRDSVQVNIYNGWLQFKDTTDTDKK